jgi:DNA-binding response OmpR family regulator
MTTILLVEDAVDLAQVIIRELTGAGYQVHHAADGLTALQLHAKHKPDLMILDWMLPKLDGLDVLRQIRESSAIPVLMLTARDAETDRVLGLETGADDYLTKPFGMNELMARIRALLRRIERVRQILADDRAHSDKAITYGPLGLNPQAYQTTLNGQALDLTRTEFDLLHLLLRNPGRAFSRAYLMDTVWGENYISGDRSVDNTVRRLRKKLGAFGEAIETVWGVGYRLRDEHD